jgi:molybdenum cofactor cytidylyltransferase
LLAEIDGEPLVRRAANTLVDSSVDSTTVVIGHQCDRIRDTLIGLPINFAENSAYREGQSTSVRAGIKSICDRYESVDAVVFALGDMPFVQSSSIDTLLTAYRSGLGTALAAAYEGERGNPALFDVTHFDTLADIEGDMGGRKILLRKGILVETGDPGVLRDVDTLDDMNRGGR